MATHKQLHLGDYTLVQITSVTATDDVFDVVSGKFDLEAVTIESGHANDLSCLLFDALTEPSVSLSGGTDSTWDYQFEAVSASTPVTYHLKPAVRFNSGMSVILAEWNGSDWDVPTAAASVHLWGREVS